MKIFTWCLKGPTPQIKNGPNQPFVAWPSYDDFKIFPQPICSSKSHKYDNYDKTTYKVPPLLLVLPGKPVHQAIHYPTANFGPLSRGSVPNPMLITVFDSYLSTRSLGDW